MLIAVNYIKFAGQIHKMASKITLIKKTGKVTKIFTCKYCNSNEFASLAGQGRVAGRFQKKIICLKCKKVVEEE